VKLVFATHNMHKFQEVATLMPATIELMSLTMLGCNDDIPETENTLEGNAWLKANFITENYGYPCFADDTGLLVDALDGAPGVYSARYAGAEKDADANMNKLLQNLSDKQNRKAQFRTVIALNLNDHKKQFMGLVEGRITMEKSGTQGFGYDPIFVPKGFHKTFAELPLAVKNRIGHRGKAIAQLIRFLNSNGDS